MSCRSSGTRATRPCGTESIASIRRKSVFHAAAHKHVHQLEDNIQEGVSNNTLGTFRIATAADRHGAEVFLLVSTDKAVRPTSVMGASKRAAELVVENMSRASRTRFSAVRFGNVSAASGSVLRIFQEQIAQGGPITLTHAGATRYFMTVEEAVGLILQSSAIARSGGVFRAQDGAARAHHRYGEEPDHPVRACVPGWTSRSS